MKGVILYADDDVLNGKSSENRLFNKFNSSADYSVLPITNLDDLENTISSVSTIRALLLDWTFKKPSLAEGLPEISENPYNFLLKNKVYSLVYIYSRDLLSDGQKNELKAIYGENKIYFEQKSADFDEDIEFEKICSGISTFEENNHHMTIPFIWSQSINKSAQIIFDELEQASSNWVKEIMDTALKDGAEPCSEVISIFHNILNESLIQNETLREVLGSHEFKDVKESEESTARLHRRLFYTKLTDNAPIMTGDIFKFDDNEYGILITPECDISTSNKNSYEFVVIDMKKSNEFQSKEKGKFTKDQNSPKAIFNNGVISRHILASFPFKEDRFDSLAVIDFSSAFKSKLKAGISEYRTSFKLNAPYIHQLRQRFVTFMGRYGVPALPDSLKSYHLKS